MDADSVAFMLVHTGGFGLVSGKTYAPTGGAIQGN